MTLKRTLSAVAVATIGAGLLPVLTATSALAAPATTPDLSAFDGTHSGAAGTNAVYYRWAAGQAISRADLGPEGSATLTTVVRADAAAVVWDLAHYGELEAVGFARVNAGESFSSGGDTFTGANPLGSPTHDGDPILFGQFNAGGAGNPFCANNKFYVAGNFEFGNGTECAIVNDSSDQGSAVDGGANRYTITIRGDGTYQGSVTPLDADGDPIQPAAYITASGDQRFTGTLPGDTSTEFAPVMRLRAGQVTTDPWQFTVNASHLTVNAVPVHRVTTGNLSVDGSSGWAKERLNGGTGEFVVGTGTPPLGTGSWTMQSHATGDKEFLHLTKVDGAPLAGRPLTDLEKLEYASYAANGTYAPYVNIPIHSGAIDANGDNVADGSQPGVPGASGNAILVYEPVLPGGSWGTNDTIHSSGLWRVTKKVVSGGVIPTFSYKTWDQWLGLLPDGVVNPTFGDIQFVIGDTSSVAWGGKSGYVDDITVITSTEAATYDLEGGLGPCPVTITGAKSFTLQGDCTTDTTLTMADGWTLDGDGHTITAVDPTGGPFTGAVLTNEAVANASMDISDVHVVGDLADGCTGSLFGIRFNGGSGSLRHSTVADIRYGAGSGCQSGNSVDVTNLGGASRLPVSVDDVQVTGFQKTGIRANGSVALTLKDSAVADAELDLVTASNSLQVSRGARAYVSGNTIGGNDWDGDSTWSATGVLLYDPGTVTFTRNVVTGPDTDFGLYAYDDGAFATGDVTITCNLFERDAASDSTPTPGQARDLWNTGVASDGSMAGALTLVGNTVTGFATPYDGVVDEVGGPCASGPVTDLAVAGGSSAVTATWVAPIPADYAPVSGYDVTLLPGGAGQHVTGTSATFAGLDPAKEYSVTVVPVNAAGPGAAAAASGATLPGDATITSTDSTQVAVSVDWSVPGTEYTGFDVTLTQGATVVDSSTTAGDARSWVFDGLTAGTDYTVTVTPQQGAVSGGSATAAVSTPAAPVVPQAPAAVSGVAVGSTSSSSLTATWTASPTATGYDVTLLPGGTLQHVTGPSAVFSGLDAGRTYSVTVVPVNSAGQGPARSASAYATASTIKASTTTVVSGKKVTITGKVLDKDTGRPVAGQTVTLWSHVKGVPTYTVLGSTRTSAANGTFSFTLTQGVSRYFYVTTSGPAHMGSTSGKVYVKARATATITLSRAAVAKGQKVTFSGRVRPKTTVKVELQRKVGRTWVTVRTTTSSAGGAYRVSWRPASGTDYAWRVRVSGATFTAGASKGKVLRVS